MSKLLEGLRTAKRTPALLLTAVLVSGCAMAEPETGRADAGDARIIISGVLR